MRQQQARATGSADSTSSAGARRGSGGSCWSAPHAALGKQALTAAL